MLQSLRDFKSLMGTFHSHPPTITLVHTKSDLSGEHRLDWMADDAAAALSLLSIPGLQ